RDDALGGLNHNWGADCINVPSTSRRSASLRSSACDYVNKKGLRRAPPVVRCCWRWCFWIVDVSEWCEIHEGLHLRRSKMVRDGDYFSETNVFDIQGSKWFGEVPQPFRWMIRNEFQIVPGKDKTPSCISFASQPRSQRRLPTIERIGHRNFVSRRPISHRDSR